MPRLSIWMVRAALLHLGVGFTVGGVLLFHKGIALDPAVWRLWPVHLELALVGWTVQLAMGVAFWILPRLQRTERYGRTGLAWLAFGLINLGVLLVAAGAWWDLGTWVSLVGRSAELLAVAAFAVYIWPRIKWFGPSEAK
jgi:hypothetical protein